MARRGAFASLVARPVAFAALATALEFCEVQHAVMEKRGAADEKDPETSGAARAHLILFLVLLRLQLNFVIDRCTATRPTDLVAPRCLGAYNLLDHAHFMDAKTPKFCVHTVVPFENNYVQAMRTHGKSVAVPRNNSVVLLILLPADDGITNRLLPQGI